MAFEIPIPPFEQLAHEFGVVGFVVIGHGGGFNLERLHKAILPRLSTAFRIYRTRGRGTNAEF